MTQPLTPQQLADVARECADNVYFWEHPEDWTPDFESDDPYDRTEASAIVEWLADAVMQLNAPRDLTMAHRVIVLVNKRDVPGLLRMVLELKGAAQ
jgi:hypothetical protein